MHHQILCIILTIFATIVIFVTSNREIVVINIFISLVLSSISASFFLLALLIFYLLLFLLIFLLLLGLSLFPRLVYNAREAAASEGCPWLLIVVEILLL